MFHSFLRSLPLILISCLPAGAMAQQGPAQALPGAPATVGYMEMATADVPVMQVLTGRAVAPTATQLRPRVSGELTAILYTPGTRVEAGTPLFSIDPLTYRTALAAAEASMARAAADLQAAEVNFNRISALRGSATSQAALDEAETQLLKAKATAAEAGAQAELARAQLDWTTVRAPVAGIVGVPLVSLGDLLTQGQAQALAEIVQIDPIHIDLSEPYPARLRIEGRVARGEVTLLDPELTLVLEGGHRVESGARLISSGATVSATTGTRILRFEAANPGGLIAPGMFLQAELTLGVQRAILVPQRATMRERDGRLSAWVAVGGKAEKRFLSEAGTSDSSWVVLGGLSDGDQLLMDGTSTIREGQEVNPVLVLIDAAGVVRDASVAEAAPAVSGAVN